MDNSVHGRGSYISLQVGVEEAGDLEQREAETDCFIFFCVVTGLRLRWCTYSFTFYRMYFCSGKNGSLNQWRCG